MTDSFVGIPGYNIIRSDSPSGIRKHGVALYIRMSIKYEVVTNDVANIIAVLLLDFNVYV